MSVAGWFPGLLPWLFDNSSDPGMRKLQRNKEEAHSVAQELLDAKRQELKAGIPRKDLMSLLGSLFPFSLQFLFVWLSMTPLQVKARDSQREGWRLTDEEVISQVR